MKKIIFTALGPSTLLRAGIRHWALGLGTFFIFLVAIFLLSGCGMANQRACTEEAKLCLDGSAVGRTGPNCEFADCPAVNSIISEAEARAIAEKSCIKGGEALTGGIYNEGTRTWWFDANLNATKPGCNPACVVNENTKTAEINWRCTGLINIDPRNETYLIEKKSVTLIDGYNEAMITPVSAAKQITRYFGNEATGDFNNDGKEDVAFLLTQQGGGSGVFYYIAVDLGGIGGTNALMLGDRIAPQTTEFKNGLINVNYAERNMDEPFTVAPSIGLSNYYKIVNNKLVEYRDTAALCTANNGIWSEEFLECENVSKDWCERNGGQFEDCASPCRHDKAATACILMCVPVCQFQ